MPISSPFPAMAEVPPPEQVWQRSNVTEENLRWMIKDGVLPEKEIIGWRATDGEAFPTANTGEIVVFESFFYCGFSVPTNRFFRGLLHFYKIELVHLNPNSVLHIIAFIHLCDVTPLVLILANCALSMIKIDLEPLHTLICAIECIWTIETAKIW